MSNFINTDFLKPVNDCSRQDLLNIENFYDGRTFHSIVIVPTEETHYSGFRCLKFIFLDRKMHIVGALGGGADIVHLNGINGYEMIPAYPWRVDCLNRSGCLRLFCDKPLIVKHYCGTSDFVLYVDKTKKGW